MTTQIQQLGATLWNIADELRGSMNADDFRDYMLSFLFLRYLSDTYEDTARKELGPDYPTASKGRTPLQMWYDANPADVPELEKLLAEARKEDDRRPPHARRALFRGIMRLLEQR